MKFLSFIFILLIINTSAFSQAKIEFENTTISFENVKYGSDEKRSFIFKNTGKETLIIEKTVFSSDHLKIINPKKQLKPGEKGEIKVIYDTKIPGPIRRTITLHSNAENKPVIALKIKGNILEKKL